MLDSQAFLCISFVEPLGRFGNHRLLSARELADFYGQPFDRRLVSIGCNQRYKGLHKMPRRTIDIGLEARVNILSRSSPPFFASRNELALDDALRTQIYRHPTVQSLR